jgi:hypothetical protein
MLIFFNHSEQTHCVERIAYEEEKIEVIGVRRYFLNLYELDCLQVIQELNDFFWIF